MCAVCFQWHKDHRTWIYCMSHSICCQFGRWSLSNQMVCHDGKLRRKKKQWKRKQIGWIPFFCSCIFWFLFVDEGPVLDRHLNWTEISYKKCKPKEKVPSAPQASTNTNIWIICDQPLVYVLRFCFFYVSFVCTIVHLNAIYTFQFICNEILFEHIARVYIAFDLRNSVFVLIFIYLHRKKSQRIGITDHIHTR